MKTRNTSAPVDRLLATADELFYAEGIRSVGIDRILAESKVAKSTLYAHFRTKEDLVAAYLRRRGSTAQARVIQAVDRHSKQPPSTRVLAAFDVFAELFAEPGYRGCPFANASAEYPHDALVQGAIADDRRWLPALFADILQEATSEETSHALARALVQLYDGAVAAAHLDRRTDSAATARATARTLLAAHAIP
ncbi:TetR/AcrR family transcriptional regulator [Brachybacterium saurashtrense]|uniref:TetR/AcrR family transcriptional regulator n=1 Tax=Brachybacterium saurashtrense TaxID=556288 RepID=A0A345YLP5_9MICO|nr:TetR/AcrR family transcriptional regulator [Brachybacterium saurashtrense]AXK44847.1 TetR/AcrR family transcriptional regulator [Brachybacterium saurashtrense]RRR20744.1 TetR/AcrR family transcriptional regulator [Brachybacterium saurashtrense]